MRTNFVKTATALILAGALVWCAARCYYFMFYVIEHYVDPAYRFSGLLAFFRYLLKDRWTKQRHASDGGYDNERQDHTSHRS